MLKSKLILTGARKNGEFMAIVVTRNLGMIFLAIYLILVGIASVVALPFQLAQLCALLAGIFILIGK